MNDWKKFMCETTESLTDYFDTNEMKFVSNEGTCFLNEHKINKYHGCCIDCPYEVN